jgi:N4-gp56 family major capsid protein
MADAYTGVGAVLVDQSAYDRAVYYGLRRNLYLDAFADVQATNQAMPGAAVIFNLVTDLSPATATLNESTDVDAVAASDANVTLTLAEKGNAMITTAKLRGTSYVDYNPVIADLVMYNAAVSLDVLAGVAIAGGTNVRYATGGATDPTARNTIEPGDIITAADVRYVLAKLRAGYAQPFGDYYASVIHPDVSYDLRSETGAAAWRDPHTYSQPGEIWSGEIGAFEGFRFVETAANTTLLVADAGSSTTLTDVYLTLFVAKQALAKAYSYTDGNGEYPMFVMSPVTDKLRRNVGVGWYWLGAYGRFREASLYRIDSSSSIGTNA